MCFNIMNIASLSMIILLMINVLNLSSTISINVRLRVI